MKMLVRNFLFHRVSDEKDERWPPMTPALFEKIISSLVKKFEVISLEEFLSGSVSSSFTRQPATILFDDGYKDNIEYAAPILSKYKCPASFYIVTDSVTRNIPTWTYLLDHVLQRTGVSALKLDFPFFPQHMREVFPSDTKSISKIKPLLKSFPNAQRVASLNSIIAQCQDVELPRNKMMTWDDIRQLKTEGFEIGSHTHTHPMLAALDDEKEIEEELVVSAKKIQEELGRFPLTISYPIGSVDERVIRLSKKTGYKYGLAVEQKFYRYPEDDTMKIPRVELYEEPWWKTKLRINGLYQKARRLWK
jgi:peptidoglycan/xylan/chitin deacetylase (PgdA/CDA1 family)